MDLKIKVDMEYRSNTTVCVEKSLRYIDSLSNNFAQDFPVEFDHNEVVVSFDSGKCRMSATEDKMQLLCLADTLENLELVKYIMSSHLYSEIDGLKCAQIIQSDYSPYFSSNTYYQSINEGDFSYRNVQEGLSLQYGTTTDLKSLMLSNRLPAGLGINLIFEGEVSFMLADQKYNVRTSQKKAECSMFVLNQEESFTRYFKEGRQVKKLNVFADLEWLKKRCRSPSQIVQLNDLFSTHAKINFVEPSAKMLSLASSIISNKKEESIEADLLVESKLVQFVALAIGQLLGSQSNARKNKRIEEKHNDLNLQISHFISEEKSGNPISLQEIAERLNVSISTLQRRFKSQFGMTVIEYARIERLEKARNALVFGGLSIGEAAYLSGYQHPSNFISAFTKYYAMSPSRYKKENRAN